MEFKYYYGNEAEQFSFIRIPKVMLTEERFSSLSLASKILYGVLLDRMALSVRNGWLDEEQRVFIIFKIEEIQDMLGFSKKKSIEYLNELEAFGLVEKKRRGLGLPSILYIKSFMSAEPSEMAPDVMENEAVHEEMGTSRGVEIDTSVSEGQACECGVNDVAGNGKSAKMAQNEDFRTEKRTKISKIPRKTASEDEKFCVRSVDLGTSGGVKMTLQEVSISEPQEVPVLAPLKNNTNINNTDLSNTESNLILSGDMAIGLDEIEAYKQLIKENIEYDCLLVQYPYEAELVEGIFDLILEMALSQSKHTVISSGTYPTELVRAKFLKLRCGHVQYVIDCLQKNTTKVKNIKKYLLAALFNAPSTISGYYTAEVNHDMPQFALAR